MTYFQFQISFIYLKIKTLQPQTVENHDNTENQERSVSDKQPNI